MFAVGYRCIACGAGQAFDYSGYQCPECKGNLDIRYDYPAIAEKLPGGFIPGRRGLFRYQPLLPVDDPGDLFPLRIGATPMTHARALGATLGLQNLYLKDEGQNPSASLKDRASAVVVRRAIDIGAGVISAASTGNAGSSLACLAAAHGMDSVIFVPENAPAAKLTQSLCFGARLLAVRGSYDDAFELCRTASEEFGWFNRSTGLNPFTREGKKTCAYEIFEDLDGQVPDRVVVASGDGNIISSIWKGWLELKTLGLCDRLPRMDCAQSEGSAAISLAVQRLRATGHIVSDGSGVTIEPVHAHTLADSISVDQPRDGLAAVRAILDSGGAAVTVTDQAILDAVVEIAGLAGVFAEPAAAATWAALKAMENQQLLQPQESVVCIVSGSGLKDIPGAMQAAGRVTVIDPDLQAVRRSLAL